MKQHSILIVDDDSISARLMAEQLKRRGFRVTVADERQDFAQIIKRDDVELILLDILMPGITGFEVLKNLRETYQPIDLPIIMLTAKDSVEDIVTCLKSGANDYLIKPAHIEVAVARIQTQLQLKSYYHESLAKKQVEALNAMIITYNHRLNNPLTVAMGCLPKLSQTGDKLAVQRLKDALGRIAEIIKLISELTRSTVEHEDYSSSSKMIELPVSKKNKTGT